MFDELIKKYDSPELRIRFYSMLWGDWMSRVFLEITIPSNDSPNIHLFHEYFFENNKDKLSIKTFLDNELKYTLNNFNENKDFILNKKYTAGMLFVDRFNRIADEYDKKRYDNFCKVFHKQWNF